MKDSTKSRLTPLGVCVPQKSAAYALTRVGSSLCSSGPRNPNLSEAGALNVGAFRADNYAANFDTLRAFAQHRIQLDSSYKHALHGINLRLAGSKAAIAARLDGWWF
jgi:hypothetical protein